ncbi:alpha/beta hydrolase [Nocardia cyriacigeorgica]|uniref:Alpha/beta hydrolase n=1 Tax=Nocardia cyriacigeorgica TaxID=135487 RepID=A0A5R8P844_9NOCA|nr:alpha/beta hydrolase [Nocardia cyriacigeorgica]
MHAAAGYVRATRRRDFASAAATARALQRRKWTARPPARLRARHDVSVQTVGGFECWTVAPHDRAAVNAVLYVHGGGYFQQIVAQHWSFIGRLADAGVRVAVPLYGLAPEHDWRQAYPLVTAVYRQLLEDFDAGEITLAGDSAGGGLALGFAQTLLDGPLPQPRRISLIAPWLDVTMTNPGIADAQRRDPWLTGAGTRVAGLAWSAGLDPADPRLSPINGRLRGIAPISIWIGTRDILYPDALRLRDRAEAAGADLTLTICDGAIHVYPLVPTPEGRAAAKQIVRQISAVHRPGARNDH